MSSWKKHSPQEIKQRVLSCLSKNVNFQDRTILGIPVSKLDANVFSQDDRLLESSVFLRAMVDNPNHIGCHTTGESEKFFAGTQELEREAIEIIATDILQGEPDGHDGYITAGGTEANIQAVWIYRNFFKREFGASQDEVMIVCSTDSHYSMAKASDLLGVPMLQVEVDATTRRVGEEDLHKTIETAKRNGYKYFICVCNMMTTMYGSVDDPDVYTSACDDAGVEYKLHVDGAYGGFIYPFCLKDATNRLGFRNPNVNSITLDAHKLLQAPFGTGVFVVRKGWMKYTATEQAGYVQGMDMTLSGSRSGANAIAVWMLLATYGPHGWYEKIHLLNHRTDWLCAQLDQLGVKYFRHPASNIVAIDAQFVSVALAEKYGLVPDNHIGSPACYKIVIMDHATVDALTPLVEDLARIMLPTR